MKTKLITEAQARRLCILVAIVAFFAGIAVAISTNPNAEPLKIEAAAGQCRYERSPDGTWWQSDYELHSIYKSNCGELGLSRKFAAAPAFGWSVRYLTLGRAHTRALARTFPADDASQKNAALDIRRPECAEEFRNDCLYKWTGDGGIQSAFNFALNADLVRLGPITFEGEAGLLLYRLQWNEQVFPLHCIASDPCDWRITVNQKSDWLLSPMAGLTARFPITDKLSGFVATRYYFRTSQHSPITAGISGGVQTWLLGIEASF